MQNLNFRFIFVSTKINNSFTLFDKSAQVTIFINLKTQKTNV